MAQAPRVRPACAGACAGACAQAKCRGGAATSNGISTPRWPPPLTAPTTGAPQPAARAFVTPLPVLARRAKPTPSPTAPTAFSIAAASGTARCSMAILGRRTAPACAKKGCLGSGYEWRQALDCRARRIPRRAPQGSCGHHRLAVLSWAEHRRRIASLHGITRGLWQRSTLPLARHTTGGDRTAYGAHRYCCPPRSDNVVQPLSIGRKPRPPHRQRRHWG